MCAYRDYNSLNVRSTLFPVLFVAKSTRKTVISCGGKFPYIDNPLQNYQIWFDKIILFIYLFFNSSEP